MFQVFLTKQVVKEDKKRGEKFKKEVIDTLQKLKVNPFPPQSQRLSGELRFVYSYHFNFSGTAFRLAYQVDEKEKTITVLMVGPRENFYQILKQRLSHWRY